MSFQITYFLLVIGALVILAERDITTHRLPNVMTMGLLLLGLVMNLTPYGYCTWQEGLLGAILGMGLLYSINRGYLYWQKKEGIGMGDAKLLAALGAVFGYHIVLFLLFLAGVVCLIFQIRQHQARGFASVIVFGPYLCATGIAYTLYLYWSFVQ